jgi:hypothetical protein
MTSRDRTILTVVLMLVVVVGGYLHFVSPKHSEAGKLQREINGEQAALQTQQQAVATGLAARATYSTFYAELARLGEAVPADADVPSLIYQVQNAATAAQVFFRQLTLSNQSSGSTSTSGTGTTAGAATAGVTTQPVSFTFDGSFFHVADFLHRLQEFVTATNKEVAVSGRLMTLNSVSITAGPNGFPQITATIGANSYLIPASSTPSIAAPAGPTPVSGTAQSTTTTAPGSAAAVTAPVK